MKRSYTGVLIVLATIILAYTFYSLAIESPLFSPSASPTDIRPAITDNSKEQFEENMEIENENNPEINPEVEPENELEESEQNLLQKDFSDIREGYLKVPFKCTGNGNEIELTGKVFTEEGGFADGSFFDDFYYPRCYGIENCNIEQHTIKLLDKDGKTIPFSNYGRIGNVERKFNVDCEQMGGDTYYAYVPYLPGMQPVSLQLDNEDKICVAGLNPISDIVGEYYVTDNYDFVYNLCRTGWQNNQNPKKEFNFLYYEIQSSSYQTGEEGLWAVLFEFEEGTCDYRFKAEYNIEEKYEMGKVYGPNTLLSVTHPFYGDQTKGTRGGGKYCNGVWSVGV